MKVVVNIGDIVGYSNCQFFMNGGVLPVALSTIEESCSIEIDDNCKRICISYPTADGEEYDIFEAHEVADDWKYLLVSWHCFDGIESEVKEFDSLIEVQEEMDRQVTEYDAEVEIKEDKRIVIDAGHEWLGWKIIDRKELYEV